MANEMETLLLFWLLLYGIGGVCCFCPLEWECSSWYCSYHHAFVLSCKCLCLTLSPNVTGAKEAHAVSPHFAQIMYFSLVSALASAPLHFSSGQCADLFQSFWKNRALSFCQWLVSLTAGFLSVHFFRLVQIANLCFKQVGTEYHSLCIQLELDALQKCFHCIDRRGSYSFTFLFSMLISVGLTNYI